MAHKAPETNRHEKNRIEIDARTRNASSEGLKKLFRFSSASPFAVVSGSGESHSFCYSPRRHLRTEKETRKTLTDSALLRLCSTRFFFFWCAFSIIGTSNMCVQQARTDFGMDKNRIRARPLLFFLHCKRSTSTSVVFR